MPASFPTDGGFMQGKYLYQNNANRINLKTIAKMAGVSVTTVSRALNDKTDISLETKRKILDIVNELGYTPDHLARSLRTRKTGAIGVIVSDITNPFFGSVIRGIEDALQKEEYSIFLCNSDENYEREERAIKTLLRKKVDGIIITPVEVEVADIFELQQSGMPLVLAARRIRKVNTSCVVANDVLGGFLAAEHLISEGHEKILYLAGPSYLTTAQERLEGHEKALRTYNIPVNKSLIKFTNSKMVDGYCIVKDLLESHPKTFTAIASFNDYLSFGALKAIYEKGLEVPKDMAVIGYDDVEFCSLSVVPLSSIRIPQYDLGYKAAEVLTKNIHGSTRTTEVKEVLLDPKLIVRSSTHLAR